MQKNLLGLVMGALTLALALSANPAAMAGGGAALLLIVAGGYERRTHF